MGTRNAATYQERRRWRQLRRPSRKAGRMRHVQDRQPLDALRMPERGVPDDGPAPVVPDEQRGPRPGGVDEAGGVGHQVGERVVGDRRGPRRPAVAAQVRRPGAVAEAGEQRKLVAPRERQVREPVQAERQPLAFAARVDLEGQAVGVDRVRLDAAAHGRLARVARGRMPRPGAFPAPRPPASRRDAPGSDGPAALPLPARGSRRHRRPRRRRCSARGWRRSACRCTVRTSTGPTSRRSRPRG